ncbi:hypothetical protein RM543_06860 [Roseicyclus sp. F158]|uniref:Uncharacterized protein n=1 Tax=Tropicimonas omnivorans TaxID=3075590 RepID=A0ABU3DFA1_9RHOB|nr:hypothetical protein [Roseicyclus sp. F158]MDT0682398.1 hypothetical protein [Roseicyclus sp. F158]
MEMQDAGPRNRPSWGTIWQKAFWTGIIAPPLTPCALGLYALVVALLRGGPGAILSAADPLSVYMWLFLLPAGSYLVGFLPALLTGGILGWALPRFSHLWQRVCAAIACGALTPIPIALAFVPPAGGRAPVPEFMALGAFSAAATLPILHRRQRSNTGRRT